MGWAEPRTLNWTILSEFMLVYKKNTKKVISC